MAYAHFEDHDEVIVSSRLGTTPTQLADFILGSVVKAHDDSQLLKRALRRVDSNASARLMALENGTNVDWDDDDDEITPIDAGNKAIEILRETIDAIEKHIRSVQSLASTDGGGTANLPHISTPEIMQRYSAVTSRSPRSSRRPPVGVNPSGGKNSSNSRSPLVRVSATEKSYATASEITK